VDYRPTNSELGALVLENRLIKQWRPQGNRSLKRTDHYVYLRCRLDIPYPILEVDPEPAPGHAINVGPMRGRKAARELADQLNSLFKLRQCGRSLQLRENPSLYGQMGRCASPCLGDLDPNAYRRQLDMALGLFDGSGDAEERLLGHLHTEMAKASAARRYERAAALLRRRERLEVVLGRLEGMLGAVHARPRLVIAPHPVKERYDAFWIVQGRVADWGPLPGFEELAERTEAALAAVRPTQASVRPDEVDEVRIVAAWLAEHEPPELALDRAPTPKRLLRFLERYSSGAEEPASASASATARSAA
jgi:DNA polymerase-3 subunit epsilon